MKKIIIAIDGPAGSGKSTSARLVARHLRYTYLDTGAMYRAITLAVLEHGADRSADSVAQVLNGIEIRVEQSDAGQTTWLNGVDVSQRIRMPDVTQSVSDISAMPSVRERLVAMQQELGRGGAIVIDGRDIGTVVFPEAELKIFLVASIEARAKRRLAESGEVTRQGLEEMALELERRDEIDSTREISPLHKAPDAIEIDTSNLSIEGQVRRIVELAQQRIGGESESLFSIS